MKKQYGLILLLGAVLFIPFLGHVHLFDWDEINFAESAREMLLTGNYSQVQIDFKPFWEKPPLFIWLQALSMNFFGVNEFAARFPNAIIGIVTLLVLFHLGRKQLDKRFGWIWVMAFGCSILPHLYFKSGIIDPLFNLFIFLGLYQLAFMSSAFDSGNKAPLRVKSLLAGVFIGLAILTKGPVALLVTLLCMIIYYVIRKFRPYMRFTDLLLFFVAAGIISFAWFGMETLRNGPWFIVTFIEYQIRLLTTADAGHGGPVYYHFVVLLLGVFPASAFVFQGFKNEWPESARLTIWMIILLVVVLVVFSIVKTKIMHYSSLAYFPLSFLSAKVIYDLFVRKAIPGILSRILTGLIGILFALALIILPYIGNNLCPYKDLVKDPFAKAAMEANIHWSGLESIIGWFYLLAVIVSLILLSKVRTLKFGLISLFLSTVVVVQSGLFIIAPKIEGYSQRAAIEFYEELKGKDVYVSYLGKSYADLFYFRKPVTADTLQPDLLRGELDKPAYFVVKVNHADGFEKDYPLERIGEKNGFVFFRRK